MRPPSPAGGPTHTSIVSYTLHWLLDGGRHLTQTFFKFTIPWRAQGEGPASVENQSGFAYFRVRLEARRHLFDNCSLQEQQRSP